MDKMLRINMTNLITQEEPLPEEYRYLGGRSLTSRIVFDEVPPTCDPLGRHNKLVFAAGLMAATPLSSSGRISIGAKSPLTGGIKESNGGGTTAQRMARLGYRGLVVEGKPEPGELFLLFIGAGRIEIKPADDLKGLGTYRLAEVLRERFGSRASLALIGPAGEMQLSSALIANTDVDGVPSRVCGRGGLGAVMGSKGLKAIVIDGSGALPVGIHDPERFREINRELTKILIDNPQSKVFELYGTAAMVDTTNALGALPTRNFSSGSFEGAEKINGDALRQTILERGGEGRPSHACMPGCAIRCSNVFPDRNGKAIVAPLEYETIGLMGSNLGIDDLDSIARLNWLCNDIGIDTIETGATLAVAMEAGLARFGDAEGAEKLVRDIAGGTVLGRALGEGSAVAGRVLGVRRVPAVKGQSFAAYDPRSVKGLGVTYATSPMGADHTAGQTIRTAIDQHRSDKQVETSRNAQLGVLMFDLLGVCILAGPGIGSRRDLVRELVASRFGWTIDPDFFDRIARQTIQTERKFNRLAGLTGASDRLPEFIQEEALPPHSTVFDLAPGDLKEVFAEIDPDL